VRDFDGDWLASRRHGKSGATCARGLSTNHFTGPGWWVWVIPLPGGDVSVGVVWDERIFDLPAGESLSERFERFLRGFPAGRELMEGATRVADDFHALHHLPYRVTRLMGDGWALVGDAAGFIDPFYSPGLDWAAITVSRTADLVSRAMRSGHSGAAIERHNRELTRGFARWFEALYRDKYFYMGDAELMEVALRLEVPLYYFGVVTQAYRGGSAGLDPPFALPVSAPFYRLMRFTNRRLASLGKIRLAAGTWGAKNAGRTTLLGGFKLGHDNLKRVPGALARLLALEIRSIPDRLAARRRAAAGPALDHDTAGAVNSPSPR
jgi:hypothetical protein